jgi:hypothetical protein
MTMVEVVNIVYKLVIRNEMPVSWGPQENIVELSVNNCCKRNPVPIIERYVQ